MIFFLLLAVALGAVFGSYLTCALYRCPRGLSLWAPPSACPHCHTKLRAADLVPVLSWVFSGGSCRHCGAPVPATYLYTELYSVALALAALGVTAAAGVWYILFLPLYGALMGFSFAGVVYHRWRQVAVKSVAFGLLCSGVYAAFLLA